MISHEESKEEHQQSRARDSLEAWFLSEPTHQPDASPLSFLSSKERKLIAAVIGVNHTTAGALCLRSKTCIIVALISVHKRPTRVFIVHSELAFSILTNTSTY